MLIGRYEVQRLIKEGGMGAVYLARDPNIGRQVAVKLIKGELTDSDRRRFAQEARAAGGLNHPNIVTIYDYGESDGTPYLVMEFVEGTTLAELIRRREPLMLERKLRYVGEMCAGLEHAHRSGVIHRDIKPANLIIDPHGVLKILDFGVARLLETTKTSLSLIPGTPGYMSPEQIQGETLDGRSDMFAAGAVFYELLSSQSAFVRANDTPASVMLRIIQEDPPPLRTLCPELDPAIERIVAKALARSPGDRFGDMGQMRTALEAAAAHSEAANNRGPGRTATAQPPTETREPPSAPVSKAGAPALSARASALVIGGLLLIAVAAAAWLLTRPVASPAGTSVTATSAPSAADAVAKPASQQPATATSAQVPSAPKTAPTGTLVDKAPSSDAAAPSGLALGEIVNGRLGESTKTGKFHYWLVDLPPGSYKIVLDVRRADGESSPIGGELMWFSLDGERIGRAGLMNGHRPSFSRDLPVHERTSSESRASLREPLLDIRLLAWRLSFDRCRADAVFRRPAELSTQLVLGSTAPEVGPGCG